MQPHESGALFGHAQRVRFSVIDSLEAMHSAMMCTALRESRDRQPMVIIRVPLVLEASCELYSDACGYSQRYNERRVCASINILDYGSSAFGF